MTQICYLARNMPKMTMIMMIRNDPLRWPSHFLT